MHFLGKDNHEARQQQLEANRQRALHALKNSGVFMTALEIMEVSSLSPADTVRALDDLYQQQDILKRFATTDGRAVVVIADESLVPEIGYSGRISSLLANAGIEVAELSDVQTSYRVAGDDVGEPPAAGPSPQPGVAANLPS